MLQQDDVILFLPLFPSLCPRNDFYCIARYCIAIFKELNGTKITFQNFHHIQSSISMLVISHSSLRLRNNCGYILDIWHRTKKNLLKLNPRHNLLPPVAKVLLLHKSCYYMMQHVSPGLSLTLLTIDFGSLGMFCLSSERLELELLTPVDHCPTKPSGDRGGGKLSNDPTSHIYLFADARCLVSSSLGCAEQPFWQTDLV